MFLCEQQKEEWWKKSDTYVKNPQYWVQDITYHSLDTKKLTIFDRKTNFKTCVAQNIP